MKQLRLAKDTRGRVDSQVWLMVRYPVWKDTWEPVSGQAHRLVSLQVRDEINGQIWRQIHDPYRMI